MPEVKVTHRGRIRVLDRLRQSSGGIGLLRGEGEEERPEKGGNERRLEHGARRCVVERKETPDGVGLIERLADCNKLF